MGLFSQYRPLYKLPERLTPDEARERRLTAVLERERERLKVENVSLSPANKFYSNQLKEFQRKFGAELEARRARMDELNRSNVSSYPKSGALKTARSRLLQLEQRQRTLLQAAASEKRANSFKPSGGDRRYWSPYIFNPRTVFGTEAFVKHRTNRKGVERKLFKSPGIALPCVERMVRREVMFARGHGGRGHRVRHRFNPLSLIGC